MKQWIPLCVVTMALGVSVGAQDSTVKSKTKVKTDDAHAVTLTGCLQQGSGLESFTLIGATSAVGDDLKSKTTIKTDVDDHDTTVTGRTKAKVDTDHGTAATAGVAYDLHPKQGLNLAMHVGHQVEVTAVMIDAASSTDDDAKVKIKEDTKAKVEDAPDARTRSKSKVEVPRGSYPQLTALTVRTISPSCS